MRGDRLRKFHIALVLLSAFATLVAADCGDSSDSATPTPAPTPTASSPVPDSLVAEWNETAMSLTPTVGTFMGMRTLATMHTAVYDAAISFDRRYSPYHVANSPPTGASQRAAAAAAAHYVLSQVFTTPDQLATLQARYDAHLSVIPDGQGKLDGIAFGQEVAQAIIALRSTDGAMAAMQVAHPDGTDPGEWRRTGTGEPMAPGWGMVAPWTLISGDQFDQGGPPLLTSQEYADDYDEVLALGSRTSAVRTADETFIASFWDPHVPAKWTGLAREISQREGLSLVDSARLFGLLSVTLADSAISVWNMKYTYNFWRPVTAITLGDDDGNPMTIGNPAWESLLSNPAFPEYVSGHSFTSSAAAALLERYLGSGLYSFELSTMGIATRRAYTSFRQAAEEAGRSRICGGIHFSFSNTQGLQAGTLLGQYVFDNFFRPVGP